MTRTRATTVAVAAVLMGLTGFRMISSRDAADAQAKHAPPPPERSAPTPPATLNLPGLALADLQTDVDELRADVDKLAHEKTSEPPPEVAEPLPPSAADPELDANAQVQALADQLDEQLAREARDRAFTQEATAKVGEFLARPEQAGTTARSVECGTSLCRVQIHHDATESREAFLDAMSDVIPPDGQGFAHLNDPRDLDIELYFSRSGHALAVPSDPSG